MEQTVGVTPAALEWAAPKQLAYTPEDSILASERSEALAKAMASLSFREREVLKMRYGIPDGLVYTLEDVAKCFNVTRERIRQIEGRAVRKLQHPAQSRPLEEALD